MTELDKKFNIVDEITPNNEYLSAHYKRSFAFYTIKERLPVIVTRVIDNLSRDKEQLSTQYGEKCIDDLKEIIGNISKLKYELQTDKPFKPLEGDDTDQRAWNNFIESLDDDKRSYFSSVWLHAECYLYRRLKAIFEESQTLKSFDYFRKQKEESFTTNMPAFIELAGRMTEIRQNSTAMRENFASLMKINLWGNRVDLSISVGLNVTQNCDPFAMIKTLESHILADDIDVIWNKLKDPSSTSTTIDIIHDNAGYEFFTDLILIDFLLTHNFAERIRCHVKMIPWFVSDVMPGDFQWTLAALHQSTNLELKGFGMRLQEYIADQRLTCVGNHFWTSGYDYNQMNRACPDLYGMLAESKLLIFKGDLNYRKLMGDINWLPTTAFEEALRGFRATDLCALRTVKADTVCGLKPGTFERLNDIDSKWMETGDYGLIQFAPRIKMA